MIVKVLIGTMAALAGGPGCDVAERPAPAVVRPGSIDGPPPGAAGTPDGATGADTGAQPDHGWEDFGASGAPAEVVQAIRVAFAAADFPEFLHRSTELLAVAGADAYPALQVRMGLALDKLGRPREADGLLEALRLNPATPPDLKLLATRYLAAARLHQDDHVGAEVAAGMVEAQADQLGWVHHGLAAQQLRLASLLRRKRLDEAYLGYQQLLDGARLAGVTSAEAGALEGLGLVLLEAGDHAQAAAFLERACVLHAARGARGHALSCQTNATTISLAAGDFSRVEAQARGLAEAARATGQRRVELHALAARAWALARLDPPAAVALAEAALAGLQPEDDPVSVSDLRLARLVAADAAGAHAVVAEGLPALEAALQRDPSKGSMLAVLAARAARVAGDAAAVEAHYQRASDRLEAVRAAFAPDGLTGFVDDLRGEVYAALVRSAAARGDASAAVLGIGRWKARAFTDRLRAQAEASVPEQADARFGLARVRLRLEREAPRPPGVAEVVAALPTDLAVLDFAVLPEAVVVVVIAAEGAEVHRVPIDQRRLAGSVETLAGALRSGAPWRDEAAWLAQHLLEPVRPRLEALRARGVARLAVVPHEALHAVPFEVLPWGEVMLVDRLPVFGSPSLGALLTALRSPRGGPALGVGDVPLAVGDAHHDLPGARAEVTLLTEVHPAARTLLGAEARVAAVQAALPRARLIHFAVHGVRPNPLAPAVLELADGHLHAHQIADLPLRADLVVLSVCDSARGVLNRSDEAVDVLDRAFLAGGARAVVASRWPVHDAASVLFMGHLHRALRDGQSALAAFHGAQLALRGAGSAAPHGTGATRGLRPWSGHPRAADYDHPYYWAAFALRGDPR